MQKALKSMASSMNYAGCEIFPKQICLNLERGDVGNFLNLPYYNANDGLRYAIKDDGTSATLEEFIKLYEEYVQAPATIEKLQGFSPKEEVLKDGPPCLQVLCKEKIAEGGRNNALFNLGVYLRKSDPQNWESKILEYNTKYIEPPLPFSEVDIIVKQLEKKEYAYRCKEPPICNACNRDVCLTRKHGVGSSDYKETLGNLRKYNSEPPLWFMDVNGKPLELDTDALMDQRLFQKACIEQLNLVPLTLPKVVWETRIKEMVEEMANNESLIIDVGQDVSVKSSFYEHLEEFCTQVQQADDKEGILLKKPWTDEVANKTFFKLTDFESYLRKNQFKEYKKNRIAQRLKEIGGESCVIKIKNRTVRVWAVPLEEGFREPLKTPDFSSDVPF